MSRRSTRAISATSALAAAIGEDRFVLNHFDSRKPVFLEVLVKIMLDKMMGRIGSTTCQRNFVLFVSFVVISSFVSASERRTGRFINIVLANFTPILDFP